MMCLKDSLFLVWERKCFCFLRLVKKPTKDVPFFFVFPKKQMKKREKEVKNTKKKISLLELFTIQWKRSKIIHKESVKSPDFVNNFTGNN